MSSSQEGPVAELDARPRETPGGLAHLGLRIRLLAASARTSTSGRSAAGDTRGIVSGSRRSTCLKTRRPSRGPFRRRPSWADLTVPHPGCRRGYGLRTWRRPRGARAPTPTAPSDTGLLQYPEDVVRLEQVERVVHDLLVADDPL